MRANEPAASGGMFPRGDEAFRNLALRLSLGAAQAAWGQTSVLLPGFGRAAREFFPADGAYLWQTGAGGELVGTEAKRWMAEEFRGRRVSLEQIGLVELAIRERRAVYRNDPSSEPALLEPGRSMDNLEFRIPCDERHARKFSSNLRPGHDRDEEK